MSHFVRHAGLIVWFALVPAGCRSTVPTHPLRIHMISGSDEYRSEPSLRGWAERLENDGRAVCTLSCTRDKAESADGLEHLAHADLLVVFCRRLELSGEQLDAVRHYLDSGRPVLGIRTASHAFQTYPGFDRDVLGGDYSGHGEAETGICVGIDPGAEGHPVLRGIEPWTRTGKLYRNPAPAADVVVLLTGTGATEAQPLAWVRERGKQRVFYTSMGLPSDFTDPRFQRLLDNAVEWLATPRERD